MIRKLLPLILILSWTSSLAQQNFIPGTIIDKEGSTIEGFIDYKNWDKNPKIHSEKPVLFSALRG